MSYLPEFSFADRTHTQDVYRCLDCNEESGFSIEGEAPAQLDTDCHHCDNTSVLVWVKLEVI